MKKPIIILMLSLNFLGIAYGEKLFTTFLEQINNIEPAQNKPISEPKEDPSPTSENIRTENDQVLQYPRAIEISREDNKILLESPDDPEIITAWYKEKIGNQGMEIVSSVQVNIQGNIRNELIGVNKDLEATVEISKKSEDKIVNINLSLNRI